MDKVFVVRDMAAKLVATEKSLDCAMSETADLLASLLKARQEINLSSTVGNEAAVKIMEALSALGEARSAMVGAHEELNEVRLRIGVRTRMVGWEEKPPKFASLPEQDRAVG